MALLTQKQTDKLRTVITENLRAQRGGAKNVPYIDVTGSLVNMKARQNHAIFARRGCGKTLLLHETAAQLPEDVRATYLNCEDFKKHTFPNVLIVILESVFSELERNRTGWFGRKRQLKHTLSEILEKLSTLKESADEHSENIRHTKSARSGKKRTVAAQLKLTGPGFDLGYEDSQQLAQEVEREFQIHEKKIRELDMWLPDLKRAIRDFFSLSNRVKSVFLQIDDFYHLRRQDQPLVTDYVHRLCKDVPLFFKLATLRHCSVLYVEQDGQPVGAQERHDFQPLTIDFTLGNFGQTTQQLRKIFHEFAKLASIAPADMDALFRGEGFERLILAGGGIPRDCLSIFLSALEEHAETGIGKDDVRILSKPNFERRIDELKIDSKRAEQSELLRGIAIMREFCLETKSNVFFISEENLQQDDKLRQLVNRLLDYRIVHSIFPAMTHKTHKGSFQSFAIDVGAYAHLRKHKSRFKEYDLSKSSTREDIRSCPVLRPSDLQRIWDNLPEDDAEIEASLRSAEATEE